MNAKARLLFVGPHLGRHPGWVITQGEILTELFAAAGHEVDSTSAVRQPILRFFDMAQTLIRRRSSVDVVILSVFSGRAFRFAEAISWLCRRLDLPLILVLRGGALPELFEQTPARARSVLARANAIVAPSGFLAVQVEELGFAAQVIPNVLALERYELRLRSHPRDSATPRLLFLRTFQELYNPLLALEALALLHRDGVTARLTLAGQDKGLLGSCRARAADLGLASFVDFPGFLDHRAKVEAFATHDVFLNTNRVDNMPVTVLEAAASGLPIVATAVGGVPFLLADEVSALLVPSNDGAALAAAVKRLLADPALMARLSEGGRQVAEASAWPRVYRQWLELFAKVIDRS